MKKAWDYLDEYRAEKEKTKSKNTVDAYISDLNQFLLFLGKDLEEITEEAIERYTAHLLGKILKPKSINRKLVSIRQYIDHLNKKEEFTHKIFIEIPMIKIQRQDYLDEVLSINDFERLVRIAEREKDERALAVFYTLYLTGVRVSELIQIRVNDINREVITIKGKGSKYRDIFIPDRLKEYLKDYVKSRKLKPNNHLFVNSNNDNPMNRQSVHNLIKKYAGLSKVKLSKAHAHNFRHLYCLRLIEEGLTIEEVADLAGHTDINTTRIYTRKTKKELIKAIKDM